MQPSILDFAGNGLGSFGGFFSGLDSPSIGLACSLTPLLHLSCSLCCVVTMDWNRKFSSRMVVPYFQYSSPFQAHPVITRLLDGCLCLGDSSALTLYCLGFYIGQKTQLPSDRDKNHP